MTDAALHSVNLLDVTEQFGAAVQGVCHGLVTTSLDV